MGAWTLDSDFGRNCDIIKSVLHCVLLLGLPGVYIFRKQVTSCRVSKMPLRKTWSLISVVFLVSIGGVCSYAQDEVVPSIPRNTASCKAYKGKSTQYVDVGCTEHLIDYCQHSKVRKSCEEIQQDSDHPCVACLQGTYMPYDNFCEECFPCSQCKDDEIEIRNCNGYQDTLCETSITTTLSTESDLTTSEPEDITHITHDSKTTRQNNNVTRAPPAGSYKVIISEVTLILLEVIASVIFLICVGIYLKKRFQVCTHRRHGPHLDCPTCTCTPMKIGLPPQRLPEEVPLTTVVSQQQHRERERRDTV